MQRSLLRCRCCTVDRSLIWPLSLLSLAQIPEKTTRCHLVVADASSPRNVGMQQSRHQLSTLRRDSFFFLFAQIRGKGKISVNVLEYCTRPSCAISAKSGPFQSLFSAYIWSQIPNFIIKMRLKLPYLAKIGLSV